MKQLELRNGDLVIGPGGFGMVRGAAKVKQDLGAAIRESLGTDRFHPRFGTVLQELIGGYQDEEAIMLIRSEISRVIQNYIVLQSEQITADMNSGRQSRYTPDEIVSVVESIEVQQRHDRINVKVSILTYQGSSVTILRSVEV